MALPLALMAGSALVGGLSSLFGPRQVRDPREAQALGGMSNAVNAFGSMAAMGPTGQDLARGTGMTRDFASMLQNISSSGGLPQAGDIRAGRDFSSALMAGQRERLSQSFEDQMFQANQAAARSGRSVNDPVLRAKLAQEQTRQQRSLDADEMGMQAKYAEQALGRRIDLSGQAASTQLGLGNMALQNQQTLFGMNQNMFGAATQARETRANPIGGFLQGALSGAGAGMNLASAFQNFGMNQQAMNNQTSLTQDFLKAGGAGAQFAASRQQSNLAVQPTQQYAAPIGPNPVWASGAGPGGIPYANATPGGPNPFGQFNSLNFPTMVQPAQYGRPMTGRGGF